MKTKPTGEEFIDLSMDVRNNIENDNVINEIEHENLELINTLNNLLDLE